MFAADLKNEPHGMSWGEPPDDRPAHLYTAQERWDAVASSVSAKLYATCPRWLIVVEGVGQCQEDIEGQPCRWPSATEQDISVNAWWGENLQGVWNHPVRVQHGASFVQNKVVCARDRNHLLELIRMHHCDSDSTSASTCPDNALSPVGRPAWQIARTATGLMSTVKATSVTRRFPPTCLPSGTCNMQRSRTMAWLQS